MELKLYREPLLGRLSPTYGFSILFLKPKTSVFSLKKSLQVTGIQFLKPKNSILSFKINRKDGFEMVKIRDQNIEPKQKKSSTINVLRKCKQSNLLIHWKRCENRAKEHFLVKKLLLFSFSKLYFIIFIFLTRVLTSFPHLKFQLLLVCI